MRRFVLIAVFVLAADGLASCAERPPETTLEFGTTSRAYGEPTNGFPTWYERFIIVMTNRARADPVTDLAPCAGCLTSSNCCADAVCYTTALPPMEWRLDLNRAARFHAANLTHTGCGMMHNSPCQLVANIDSIYPGSCDGEASCACQGGTASCSGGTNTWDRLALFGASGGAQAENIAWFGDPMSVFYAWLRETTSDASCSWSMANGHRYNILAGHNKIGVGGQGGYTVQDFWTTGGLSEKIPAGAHYPETSSNSSVEFRANWYDTAGPSSALVNIDGSCYPLSQERGMTASNGTYLYTTTLSSTCHRYYFIIEDSASVKHYYPDTGAFGVNCTSDWDNTAPPEGTGCSCTPSCGGAVCGNDGCGGSCGSCTAPDVCQGGQCVCTTTCGAAVCGPDGCGDSCGSCAANELCQGGQCACQADCTGAVCGDDGCGGTCGNCAANELCVSGQCVCQPECTGMVCGDDGCGSTCGSCAANELCVNGQCVCQPDCTGAVCGNDGCGGSCGSCPTGEVCQTGQCATSCDTGYTLCDTDCVDTDTSTQHCGGCDQPCDPGETCEESTCTPTVGPDAGVGTDGGVTSDASPYGGSAKGGCKCTAAGGPDPGGLMGLLLLLLVLGAHRRRR